VALTGHPPVVAKHQPAGLLSRDDPWNPCRVEQEVLDLLGREGCPVPRFLAVDPEAQVQVCEDRGAATLDDVAQDRGARACRPYLVQVVDGLRIIEAACERHRAWLAARQHPAAGLLELERAWEEAGAEAHDGLGQLLGEPGPGAAWHGLLERGRAWLGSRPATLGPTDYNARNLVVDPAAGRLTFVEFSQIGWDWTERRLVQYTWCPGSGRPAGRFRSLLDRRAVARFAGRGPEAASRRRAADWHDLHLHLIALARLEAARRSPGEEDHARLLAAWTRPRQRRRDLARSLSRPLSDDPEAAALRAALRQALAEPRG
jgi:hypothetical protein